MTLTLDFEGQTLKSSWIDMEPKRYESIGCWTQVVILNFDLTHDLDLGFSRSNFNSHILRMERSIDLE